MTAYLLKPCLHCGREKKIHCRGLCKACLHRPGVRDLYPRQKRTPGYIRPYEKVCRHCTVRRANRCRGLCFSCHSNPRIRSQYGTCPKYGPKPGTIDNPRSTEPSPTDAIPGTTAKILVLEERVRLRQSTSHPCDADEYPEPVPLPKPPKALTWVVSPEEELRA